MRLRQALAAAALVAPLLMASSARAEDSCTMTDAQMLPRQGVVQVHHLSAGTHYQPSAVGDDGSVRNLSLLGHDGGPRLVSVWQGAEDCSGSRTASWAVTPEGHVYIGGTAGHFGQALGLPLNRPIVGMAVTPTGLGYWLVASDGGIFAYGDAPFEGSTGAMTLNQPIVAMASTPSGHGYWLAAADGGLFTFGDARFLGSMGAKPLNAPIVGMVPTSTGRGYWMVARDGGIFTFGDAMFEGSTGGQMLMSPVAGMVPFGTGYAVVDEEGMVTAFGDMAEPSTGGHDHGTDDGMVNPDSIISLDDPRVTATQRAAAQALIDRTTEGMQAFPDEAAVMAAGYASIGDGATGYEHFVNLAYLLDSAE